MRLGNGIIIGATGAVMVVYCFVLLRPAILRRFVVATLRSSRRLRRPVTNELIEQVLPWFKGPLYAGAAIGCLAFGIGVWNIVEGLLSK